MLPTIPEYFKRHVNSDIDLNTETSIACPFHNEQHGKSFTYSPTKKVFRCWGACHTGGDVIALHQLNYHYKTRDEARISLYSMYGEKMTISFEKPEVKISQSEVKDKKMYTDATNVTRTPEDMLELLVIMSQEPVDIDRLETYVSRRG